MSIEESINVLDEIAEGFEKLSAEVCARTDLRATWEGRAKGIRQAITLIKAHLKGKPNDPLTLEQLREMDGEPVYFQFGDGTQGWAIAEKDVEGIVLYGPDFDDHAYPDSDFINMEYNDPAGHFGLHVLGWRAYRRRPEEGTK